MLPSNESCRTLCVHWNHQEAHQNGRNGKKNFCWGNPCLMPSRPWVLTPSWGCPPPPPTLPRMNWQLKLINKICPYMSDIGRVRKSCWEQRLLITVLHSLRACMYVRYLLCSLHICMCIKYLVCNLHMLKRTFFFSVLFSPRADNTDPLDPPLHLIPLQQKKIQETHPTPNNFNKEKSSLQIANCMRVSALNFPRLMIRQIKDFDHWKLGK